MAFISLFFIVRKLRLHIAGLHHALVILIDDLLALAHFLDLFAHRGKLLRHQIFVARLLRLNRCALISQPADVFLHRL